jgi:hypothetical protein
MAKKGEIVSADSIALMKESKRQRMLSRFNWVLAEPYLDVEIDNGSVSRSKEHITLRQFKQRIEAGETMKAMCAAGVSKHLSQFMSNFCQGKISLTREDFVSEYETGASIDEIGEKYSVNREDMTFLRQLYGIKRKGATFINRKKTEVLLTQRQKEIIYGSLMGDGKKCSPSSVGFVHSPKQKTYLFWKYSELESVVPENSLKRTEQMDKRYDKIRVSWRFYTHANTDIEKIVSEFYGDEDKQITGEVLDNLTPLSIAVWYMDDGYRGSLKGLYPCFCTDMFSLESCENIKTWFAEKFDIQVRIKLRGLRKDGQSSYRIIVCVESISDFVALIEPHILPAFRYKLGM